MTDNKYITDGELDKLITLRKNLASNLYSFINDYMKTNNKTIQSEGIEDNSHRAKELYDKLQALNCSLMAQIMDSFISPKIKGEELDKIYANIIRLIKKFREIDIMFKNNSIINFKKMTH